MKVLNTNATALKDSVFSVISQRAMTENAINLAQGFPDFEAPQWVLDTASRVLYEGKNQYSASMGCLPLRKSIAKQYAHFYDVHFKAESEILVTNGATEAIYATITAMINPGDEVILFEPYYDSYAASVELAGGVVRAVTLHAPDFNFDRETLQKTISHKTKLVVFNNPQNPTGKVFEDDDKLFLLQLAQKHDFYVLSDEVYEFLSYSNPHKPLAHFTAYQDRILTISSVGKTLSLTGWKIGWVCGKADIIKIIHNVHQFICFCVTSPLQMSLAESLLQWPGHLETFQKEYIQRKDLLVLGLQKLGAKVYHPQGTYFALMEVPHHSNDWDFCNQLITEHKVATIPLSPFYRNSTEGTKFLRFCFAKKIETIQNALKNLQGAKLD